jgi:hypothetical protein
MDNSIPVKRTGAVSLWTRSTARAYQPSGEKTIISPLTMLMSVSERVSSVTSSWLSGTVSRGVLDFHA